MLSAGVVVINRVEGVCRYLLLRVYRYWDFPKGLVEPNETPKQAAEREVHEETGIDLLDFPWGECYIETEPYGSGKVARYYLAVTSITTINLRVNKKLGKLEHHEYRWLEYPAAAALLVPRVRGVLDWANHIVTERCY